MITQKEFIEQCRVKYRYEALPEGERWEDAHYPVPKCKRGADTIPLWKSDHAAHNVIQSEEIGYPCIFGWEINYLTDEYSYLIPYFHKWKKICCSIAGASAKEKQVGIFSEGVQSLGGQTAKAKGVGIFSEGVQSLGGVIGGKVAKEKGVGIFSEGMQSLGGNTSMIRGTGLFGLSPGAKKEAERRGGRTTGKLPRWTNGNENRYCEEQPGPEWYHGVTRKKACEA
jgi:hypothetical protein